MLRVEGFAESQNTDTRQSLSLPSVALGKDLHWAKSGFAERQKERKDLVVHHLFATCNIISICQLTGDKNLYMIDH